MSPPAAAAALTHYIHTLYPKRHERTCTRTPIKSNIRHITMRTGKHNHVTIYLHTVNDTTPGFLYSVCSYVCV